MTKYYFADDGNYGDAEGLLVVDDNDFSTAEWEVIETAHDSERLWLVRGLLGMTNA
jgi:hypothetical protein